MPNLNSRKWHKFRKRVQNWKPSGILQSEMRQYVLDALDYRTIFIRWAEGDNSGHVLTKLKNAPASITSRADLFLTQIQAAYDKGDPLSYYEETRNVMNVTSLAYLHTIDRVDMVKNKKGELFIVPKEYI